MNIVGIETKDATYIRMDGNRIGTSNLKFDGESLSKTWDSDWFKLKSPPKEITTEDAPKVIRKYYEIKDESLISDKIPRTLEFDDVMIYDEYDYEYDWRREYSHLSSLYNLEYVYSEAVTRVIPFEYECILKSDDFKISQNVKFEDYRGSRWNVDKLALDRRGVEFRGLDKIIFPRVVYENNCPLIIKSDHLYSIIREHIKQNIDLRVSKISSDYDFCFTVKRLICYNEPKTKKIEITKSNGKPYARARYRTKVETISKSYDIFEMTPKSRCYNNYSVLPDLHGDDADDLHNKVKILLAELMEFINKPNNVCPHCDGVGFIGENKKIILSEFFK